MPSLKIRAYNSLLGSGARTISVQGIFIGGLVDVVSSFLLSIPFIVFTFVQARHGHVSAAQRHVAIVASRESMASRSMEWMIGVGCSMLGGYIAAKIARRAEILNGGSSAIFAVALGLYWMFNGKNIYPLWLQVLHLISSIVFAWLGGYLWLRQNSAIRAEVRG